MKFMGLVLLLGLGVLVAIDLFYFFRRLRVDRESRRSLRRDGSGYLHAVPRRARDLHDPRA